MLTVSSYDAYKFLEAGIKMGNLYAGAFNTMAAAACSASGLNGYADVFTANAAMNDRFSKNYSKPSFNLGSTVIAGKQVAVEEETVMTMPFGNLIRFKRDTDKADPKLLLVAPLSGHYATLVKDTVRVMLSDFDVYLTDWTNARDVPLRAGNFGLGDYADYVRNFMTKIGPNSHTVAVCQSTVPVLAAAAMMAEDGDPNRPLSMTLMAGPIDARELPTKVNEYAMAKPLSWFERNLISRVPYGYDGAGREVYPGHIQLNSFMAMNLERHIAAHMGLYGHVLSKEFAKAAKTTEFYDEYLAVLDLDSHFYLETVDMVFQKHDLAQGRMVLNGRRIDPSYIDGALLTIEGEKDDICGLGQTMAAHKLCPNAPQRLAQHHQQAGAGHYGVFSGKRWEKEIYPVVNHFIHAADVDNMLKLTRKITDTRQLPSNSGKELLTTLEPA